MPSATRTTMPRCRQQHYNNPNAGAGAAEDEDYADNRGKKNNKGEDGEGTLKVGGGRGKRRRSCDERLEYAFRMLFLFWPGLIFRHQQEFSDYFGFRGTHVRIKSFQGKINLF